jgi:signal transduction histidine kinase
MVEVNGGEWGEASSDRLIRALLDISHLVGSVMRLDDILARIVSICGELMEMPTCSLYLLDERRRLVLRSSRGMDADAIGRVEFAPGEGIPGWVVQTGEPLSLPDASRDPRYRGAESNQSPYRAIVCAPLRIQTEIVGVLSVRSPAARSFSRRDLLVLETVCKMVAIVIEKARLYNDMIKAKELAAVAISLSGTAHYIKNILFTTQLAEANIDKAMNEGLPPESAHASWNAMKESSRQIGKLVASMLNYSREEPPVYTDVDLPELIRDVVARLQPLAGRSQVRFVLEFDPGVTVARLDRDEIRDVLLNLVTNGIDAIPSERGGQVWIRTARIENQNNFRIEVADNGTGISDEVRGRMFELFFTTKGEAGYGIGLSSTRKVVQEHGGTIEFDSTVGQGTCFRVFLPFRPAELLPGA